MGHRMYVFYERGCGHFHYETEAEANLAFEQVHTMPGVVAAVLYTNGVFANAWNGEL